MKQTCPLKEYLASKDSLLIDFHFKIHNVFCRKNKLSSNKSSERHCPHPTPCQSGIHEIKLTQRKLEKNQGHRNNPGEYKLHTPPLDHVAQLEEKESHYEK